MPPKKLSSNDNNVNNNVQDTQIDNPVQPTASSLVQQDTLQLILNSINGINSRLTAIEQKQAEFSANASSNTYTTPVKSVNTPTSINSTATTVTIDNNVESKSAKSTIRDKNLVDKDLHPILNSKLELDLTNAPKLTSISLSADEYINWYNKLKAIIYANPRFRLLLTNTAEDAWRFCGGLQWTSNLHDTDLDRYRWESSFVYSLNYLYTHISRLIPEDVFNGIRLHMLRDRGKYDVPTRLGFTSTITAQYNDDSPFCEDVYEFMKLLEERYNTKDCNRLNELFKAFKRIHLGKGEHPQTIFTRYQETVNRIKTVYPDYKDQSEGFICFDILTRVGLTYNEVVKELFRKDVKSLKKEDVLKRLVAEYMHTNKENHTSDHKTSSYKKSSTQSTFKSTSRTTSIPTATAAEAQVQNKYNVERTCFRCFKAGHMAYNCPERKPTSADQAESDNECVEEDESTSSPDNADIESSSSESNFVEEQEIDKNDLLYDDDEHANPATFTNAQSHQGIADTGATLFLTGDKSKLINLRPANPTTIHGVGGSKISNMIGDMPIPHAQIILKGVRYIPNHPTTLISMGRLSENGFDFHSYEDKLYIVDRGYMKPPKDTDPRVIMIGERKNGLYVLNITKPPKKVNEKVERLTVEQFNRAIQESKSTKITKPEQLIRNKTSSEFRKELNDHRNNNNDNNKPKLRIPKYDESKNINNTSTSNVETKVGNESNNMAIEEARNSIEIVEENKELEWHKRLGHASRKQLLACSKIYNLNLDKGRLDQLKFKSNCICETCLLTRIRSMSIGQTLANRIHKVDRIMATWHVDLIGPISFVERDNYRYKIPSLGGNIYALIVVDEASRYTWSIPIRNKSDATQELINLILRIENLHNNVIHLQQLHSDQGGEFINDKLNKFLTEKGITHTTSPAYLPQYNSIIERKNKDIIEY
ncbi:MAG: DDE-type integrase/transposase/recombinase, partial [Nitrososphaeraceae archaeon]